MTEQAMQEPTFLIRTAPRSIAATAVIAVLAGAGAAVRRANGPQRS